MKEKICGIYKITNNINGKIYIGQSSNINKRWAEHRRLGRNDTKTQILYKAMNKYGVENFEFEIVELCDLSQLDDKEQYYIRLYRTYIGWENSNGYNMSLGGNSHRGIRYSDKTKEIWSKNRSGENNSRAIPVICDGKRFGTIKECANFYNVDKTAMQRWLNQEDGMPYAFVDKKLRYENSEFKARKTKHSHEVIYDGIIFQGFNALSRYLGLKEYKVGRCVAQGKFPDIMLNHSLFVDGVKIDTANRTKS